jgi:hypothetical protein
MPVIGAITSCSFQTLVAVASYRLPVVQVLRLEDKLDGATISEVCTCIYIFYFVSLSRGCLREEGPV